MATVEEQTQAPIEEQKQAPESSAGMDPKIGGLVSYLFGWITGLIMYLIEKENKYVRFHAMQSILLSVATTVIFIGIMIILGILTQIPGLGLVVALLAIPINGLLGLGFFALWIFMMYKGFSGYDTGEKFKLPIIGDQAEKIVG